MSVGRIDIRLNWYIDDFLDIGLTTSFIRYSPRFRKVFSDTSDVLLDFRNNLQNNTFELKKNLNLRWTIGDVISSMKVSVGSQELYKIKKCIYPFLKTIIFKFVRRRRFQRSKTYLNIKKMKRKKNHFRLSCGRNMWVPVENLQINITASTVSHDDSLGERSLIYVRRINFSG